MRSMHTVMKKIVAIKYWFLKASLKKKLLVIFIAGVVLFVINNIFKGPPAPQLVTDTVQRSTVIENVTETGNVATQGQTEVNSSATGIIEELYVDNNETVEADQNLFKVKSTATDQEKASAYASYQSAVSTLTSAKQGKESNDAIMWQKQQAVLDAQNNVDYKNNNTTNPATKKDYTDLEKQSIESSLVQARKDFAAAEQKYKESDISIAAAQAQVNATWQAYAATQSVVVKAPIAGTVSNLAYGVGDKVTASGGSGGGAAGSVAGSSSANSSSSSPVLIIANFGSLFIKLQMSEVDIAKVHEGQSATVTFDAVKDKTFDGHVTQVDGVGTNTNGVVTYNVYVALDTEDDSIKPGMTANVTIETARHENVLTVPNAAVRPFQGGKAVRVLQKKGKNSSNSRNGIQFVPVKTGIKGTSKTEILSGLDDGMTVVVSSTTLRPVQSGTSTQTPSPSTTSQNGGTRGGLRLPFGGGGRAR